MRTVANPQSVWTHCVRFGVPPHATRVGASTRSAHAPVAAAPLLRTRMAHPDAPGRKPVGFLRKEMPVCDACASSANAGNKTPPGFATRGRSLRLGRSGWPISQGVSRNQLSMYRFDSSPAWSAHATVPWLGSRRASTLADALAEMGRRFMGTRMEKTAATKGEGAHDTPVVFRMQHFFNASCRSTIDGARP